MGEGDGRSEEDLDVGVLKYWAVGNGYTQLM